MVKNPPANAGDAGDLGLIPGSGRSPGGLDYWKRQSILVHFPGKLDRGAWQAEVQGVSEASDTTEHTHVHVGRMVGCKDNTHNARPRNH